MTPAAPLLQAVRDGDLPALHRIVATGADVNMLVEGMFRPLSHPGAGDRLAVVRFLLAHGADPQLPGYDGASALDLWAYEGEATIVKELLEHGADPNLGCAPTRETPLHYAASRGHLPGRSACVEVLLAAGADPNRTTGVGVPTTAYMRDTRVRGETPLHRAAVHGDEHMIRALLDHGADPGVKDANGDSPLSWASWARRPDPILKLLLYGEFRGSMNW